MWTYVYTKNYSNTKESTYSGQFKADDREKTRQQTSDTLQQKTI